VAEHPIPEEDRNLSRESDGERRVATPTATESQLPWKRQGDECTDAVQQNEFPAWASNKEYLAYNSPSATFLGNVCNTQLFKLFRIFNNGIGNEFFRQSHNNFRKVILGLSYDCSFDIFMSSVDYCL